MDPWCSSLCGQNSLSSFPIFFCVSPLLSTSSSTHTKFVTLNCSALLDKSYDFRIFNSELLWWEIAMCVAAEGVSQVTINYIQFTVSTPYRLKYLKAFIFIFLCLRTPVKTRNSYWKLKNRYIKRFLNSFLLEFSFPNEFHSVSIKDTAKPQNQINFRTGDYGHPRRTHGQSIGWGGDYKSALLEYQEKELESGLA